MSGLTTLEELLTEHELDDICTKHNEGTLTLYGWDSHNMAMVRAPLATPLEASLMPHQSGTALRIGVEVYRDGAGDTRLEPRYYWGVVAIRSAVVAAWGSSKKAKGRSRNLIMAVMEVLRNLYPDGRQMPSDKMLVRVVSEKLGRDVSRTTVRRARGCPE